MSVSLKTEPLFADTLKGRLDYSLTKDDFIECCLENTKLLHQETNDSSQLLFYAMLILGKHTKGSNAVQQFTRLFKEMGNVECADIVHNGAYRSKDLEFYWSTSRDLSHLFTPSSEKPINTYSSSEADRDLDKPLMSDVWTDYAFYEVDKIPNHKKPRNWHLYKVKNATLAYDTAEFVVLDSIGNPVIDLCSAKYQHVYFTDMFRDYYLNNGAPEDDKHHASKLNDALMIQDLIRKPNFCHWLLDQLPRLRQLEDSQSIIMYTMAPFMKNMIESMNIDSNRVHELGERAVVDIDSLTIESSMAKHFYHPCQDVCLDLIDYIEGSLSTDVVDPKPKDKKLNVYLSRNKYDGRRISNEDDLLKILEKYGFHTVYPEELSMAEQISLFRNAEVIVSPHGASLANTIFCKNVTLIEIFNQNYGTPTFYIIAKLLGFQYQHILGTNPLLPDDEKQRIGLHNLQYEDMEVDIAKLEECLSTVFPNFRKTRGSWLSAFARMAQRLVKKST